MHPELRRWSFRGWLRANGHDPNLEQYTQEKLALFSSYVGEVRLALFLSYVGEVRLALFLSYVGEVRLALFSSYVGEVRLALFLSYVGEVRLALFLSYVGEVRLALFLSYVGKLPSFFGNDHYSPPPVSILLSSLHLPPSPLPISLQEVRVRVERCDSKTRSVFVTQRGADLEDEERVERREQLQVDGVNVMIHYDSIRQLKQGPVDTWPFPIGHQARCKRSYLRHLKNSLPPPPSLPPPLPLSPPPPLPVSLLRSLCPLLRSLCLPPPPLLCLPLLSAPSVSPLLRSSPSNPSCTGQSLPVHVLRSKSVQKRLLVALEPPFPNLPCVFPLSPFRTLPAPGQSLPVHVLRRKPVQKRLLIALQPPFPVLMRSSPLFSVPCARTHRPVPAIPASALPASACASQQAGSKAPARCTGAATTEAAGAAAAAESGEQQQQQGRAGSGGGRRRMKLLSPLQACRFSLRQQLSWKQWQPVSERHLA
ncbi:unnamed protein product [Closterium sp. NIES-65]|nr:unnamed protein product [Closterium sp. NIES-65]